MSATGGLGALVGVFLPWFVFVMDVVGSCRAPLQIEQYDLSGIEIALGGEGWLAATFGIVALLCAVYIVIAVVASARQLRRARIRRLVAASLVGLGALGAIGARALSGHVFPTSSIVYHRFLGFGPGYWLTAGGLALALIGGAVLHEATRQYRESLPLGEMALATIGIVALLGSIAGAILIRPAPYPGLICAQTGGARLTAGSAVYVTTTDGVYALDAANGHVAWSCRNLLGGVLTGGAPALASGVLFVASLDGYVYAVRADDAAILWRTDVGGRGHDVYHTPVVTPIVENGVVYGVNGDGVVFALRASDGASAWTSSAARPIAWLSATLTVADGALIYPSQDLQNLHLTAVDARTGQLLWQSPDPLQARSYPVSSVPVAVQSGVVYDEEVSPQTQGSSLVARSVKDGVARWRYPLLPTQDIQQATSVYTVADGVVYLDQEGAAQLAMQVVALRARDGSVIWSAPTSNGALTQDIYNAMSLVTMITDGGEVYIALDWVYGDTVYRLDAQRGTMQWRYLASALPHGPPPAFEAPNLQLMGEYVYMRDRAGSLLAMNARTGASAWRFDSAGSQPPRIVTPTASTTAGATASSFLYTAGASLYAIDPSDGAAHWKFFPPPAKAPYSSLPFYALPRISPPTLG